MFRIICIVLGYLFGCLQTAYILAKFVKNIDIRNYGSGNAGTTNIIRVLGWKAGVITFIGDFLKAVIAVLLCKYIFSEYAMLAGLYAGIGVIMGHNWPFFLKFKGGKGIASTIGIMFAVDYRVGLILASVLFVTILISKYVSLGSILLAIFIPIVIFIFYKNDPLMVEMVLVSLLYTISAVFKHRGNIKRLLSGTESKLGQKSQRKVEDKL